ncbi:MAG: hypothetical protein H6695_11280 [Deferribacteres bacterium]|nr:hypothetical protein [candidate division KSB1 bacterium]MCB9510759.1 hypothetical protein [Deferribacteres bacterium]
MIDIQTSSGKWEKFCQQIETFLQADLVDLEIDGERVRGYRSPDSPALWIRDHSDIMRGGKYFESDLQSAVNCFANSQARNGRVFDHVLTRPLKHSNERENWEKWVRVPVEADVEYRFVKAAQQAWQATGDHAWLRDILPALELALHYSSSHPLRWDAKHQLVKRPYTIDTWDFDYTAGRQKWLNFQITDDTFWGIMHCDNSGVYEAAQTLATMNAFLGNSGKAEHWQRLAEGIRERANALLFNGRFYTHFHKLTPIRIEGVDEAEQLSLSTPMAITRKLATHEIAVAILQEYQRRKKSSGAFAEWFGIHPPFPDGIFGDEKLVGGAYINGGIFPLSGGELACAAFAHGFESYGLHILDQYRAMIAESNATYLWYFPDGRASTEETSTSPEAMPTDGWGSTAMLHGFIEGLCGIEDLTHSFQKVRCSPRWAATDEKEADIKIGYAASGATFGYRFQHYPENKTLLLEIEAQDSEVEVRLLLPKNSRVRSMLWDGKPVQHGTETIESSQYAVAKSHIQGITKIGVHYES